MQDRDAEEIDELVAIKADLNIRDSEGYTPLHRAADMEAADVCEALLKGNIDINARCEVCIAVVASCPCLLRNFRRSHPPPFPFPKNGTLWTATHIAALSGFPQVLEVILKYKPDLSVVDSRGETALQWAEANKEDECIELLKKAS